MPGCRFIDAVVAACESATNVSSGRDGVTPGRLHLLHFLASLTAAVTLPSRDAVLSLLFKLNRVVSRRMAMIEGAVSDRVRINSAMSCALCTVMI